VIMNILAIGIHPDDIELGCGGTVALAVLQKQDVAMIDLSDGAASTNGTTNERAKEAEKAAAILGVEQRSNVGLPDTEIQSEDPEQTRRVVDAIRQCRPDVILAPSSDDPHPDHSAGGELVGRAVYLSGLRGYDAKQKPWQTRTVLVYGGRIELLPQIIIDVTATYDAKMQAIKAHRSQFVLGEGREPTVLNSPEFLPAIEARDRLFGKKIRAEYGEAFRVLHPLGVKDLAIFGA